MKPRASIPRDGLHPAVAERARQLLDAGAEEAVGVAEQRGDVAGT